ncbi:MAG: site-specific integrase [Alphaproteobacteria bacterium]|nr:site-specific integrase [Alphaproteobacteria bacterium]
MAKNTERLTKKLIDALPLPSKGNKITYDDAIKGFGIRVTHKGVKSFVLNYVVNGRERRYTIGQLGAWTVTAAREKAAELKRQVDNGIDPLEIRETERSAMSVKELWKEFEKRHLPSLVERSQKDVTSMFNTYILPQIGKVRLKDLTGAQIDDLHKHVTKNGGSTRANRVLEALRSAINKGIRWGYCERNPADGFKRNAEEAKENYLTPAQLETVFDKLNEMPNEKAANIVRMLILTGARIGEVLKAEWTHFDLDKALWIKPSSHTKQKRVHKVPLALETIELLEGIKERSKSKYLFPSETGKPMHDIKKPWAWLQKETGIKVRIHDLRHTFASLLISEGENLAVIGKLLGHSQHQTTMRYAHLMDDPLRAAAGKIGAISRKKTND